MRKKVKEYISNRLYELHIFRILGFSGKDYATFKIVSTSKHKNSGTWLFNNFYFPLMVVVSPFILTLVHNTYNTVAYKKTLLEILISGSFTLIGINVIRTASTSISEKLDDSKVPTQFKDQIDNLFGEIDGIRNKLERRVWVISYIGWGLYLLQIGQFVNDSSWVIYIILSIVIILTLASIIHGRFIFLMKTNLFDKEEVVMLLFGKLLGQKNDFKQLEELLKNQGL
jgi:hypothetical protein